MSADSRLAFFAGDSDMARLMRERDWADCSLGPPQGWPQSLRSVVNLLLGSAFPMFVAWGPELVQLYNDAYALILGAKHPRAMGRPLLENWAEISADIGPLAERALKGDSQYLENMPLKMRRGRGDGEDTWFTFSYSPVQDDDGVVAGMFCACIETTKSVLAEQQQIAEQEWLKSLFHQAPGFAAVLRGRQHVFEMANEAYMRVIGHRDLIGRPLAEALPEVVEQGFLGWLDGVFETGVPFVGRSVPVKLDHGPGAGSYDAFIDFMYQPLRNPAGAVEGIFVQGHDVTEQHRAQQALREADRQKDEFLATLAHELRNPLAPLQSAAHLLEMPGVSSQARARAVDVIGRQVGHMSRLLDDLIDIARITQRRLLLKKQAVPVGAVVDAAMEAARPLAERKGHALTVRVADPATTIVADSLRLTQVLSNLLNNASKYTDAGGRIELEASQVGESFRFAVTDNGIGMSPHAIQKLFLMFAQEQEALDRSEGGLGIGLALARGLVELHGGTVRAFSEGLGQGSRFVVDLPLNSPLPATAPQDAPPAAPRSPRACSVLLADDNRDAIDLLAELLRMQGHIVHTAHDGVQAAELALHHRPDVLVLDIGMPGLNGYEVARRVRAQSWGDRPLLIAATGWGQEADRRTATDAGFNVHLTKPFDPGHLTSLIEQHVG